MGSFEMVYIVIAGFIAVLSAWVLNVVFLAGD